MSRRLESFEDISVEVSKLNVLEVETQRSIVILFIRTSKLGLAVRQNLSLKHFRQEFLHNEFPRCLQQFRVIRDHPTQNARQQ